MPRPFPPLLEREPVLAVLREAIAGARESAGAVAIVEGPLGIGKSSVLTAAAAAADDCTVLTARGTPLEQSFGFGVVRQLFAGHLRHTAASDRRRLLRGAARLAIPAIEDVGGAVDAESTLHGLYWLAAGMAEDHPLVLAVDDAHWADAASLRWVAYLAARMEHVPIAVLLATRPASGETATLLSAIASSARSRPVLLPPLTEVAVEALLGRDGSQEDARRCREATGGNPLLVVNYARWSDGDAATLDAAGLAGEVTRGVAALGPDAMAAAAAAAVLEPHATVPRIAALCAPDGDAVPAALDALTRAGVLADSLDAHFVHPLMREAVQRAQPPHTRSRLHRRAADVLARDGLPAQVVGAHLLHTAPDGDPEVATALRAAADAALTAGAPDAAVAYLARALDERPPGADQAALLSALGQAELAAGRPQAIEHLEAAYAAASGPDRVRHALVLAQAQAVRQRGDAAIAVLREIGAQVGDEDEAVMIEAALLLVGQVDSGSRRHIRADIRTAVARSRRSSPDLAHRALAAALSVEHCHQNRPASGALDLARHALDGGALRREAPMFQHAHVLALAVLTVAGAPHEAVAHLDQMMAEARASGSARSFAIVSSFRALAHFVTGDLVLAEADARAGFYAASGDAMRVRLAGGHALILALSARGDHRESLLVGETMLQDVREEDAAFANWPLAYARLQAGQLDAGVEVMRAIGPRFANDETDNVSLIPWRPHTAMALAALGHREEALETAAEGVSLARRFGEPRGIAIALRGLAAAQGDGPAALASLRDAIVHADRASARLEQARARAELGAMLRRAGHRSEAVAPLREALDLARACGADPLAERTREELVIAGARPRRERLTGVEALTPSELRVARMAAEGMTNRAIAEALFVTSKAVERHLTSTYAKLGIAGRDALAAALTPSPQV